MPTLQYFENDDWGDPKSDDTGLVRRCLELRRKPLCDFDEEDLRLMLGQQMGTDHLVPLAIAMVETCPTASGMMYEGALIENLVSIDNEWWVAHPADEARLCAIIDKIDWSDDFEKGVRGKVERWANARRTPGTAE